MEFFYYYSLSLFDFRPLTYLDVNFFLIFFSPKKIWPPIFSGAFSHFSPTYIIVGSNHMFQNWLIGKKVAIIFIFLSFVQRKHNILDITYWHQLQVEHDTSSFRLSLETNLQSWLCRRLISNKQPLYQTTPDTGHHKVILLQYIWLKVEIIKVLMFKLVQWFGSCMI